METLAKLRELVGERFDGIDAREFVAAVRGLHPVTRVLEEVAEERGRQDAKWGEQNHDPFAYLAILTEEVGELAKAALHARYGGPEAEGMREEAIQCAAVAVAIVQCLDRGKWTWGAHAK